MITHTVNLLISNAKAKAFYDFMLNPNPEIFKKWLPKEHHEFYKISDGFYYYDEHLGDKYRLKFYAKSVVENKPNQWVIQMRKLGLNLPAFLDLQFRDTNQGLQLKHEVRIGWKGFLKIIDPVLKLFYTKDFFAALKGHCGREWIALAELLRKY
ncbi:MAG: hypothetical protein LBN23_06965 [Paludibacter sp.]|jgi:hypothetical protein|nr:hypothetical protein [Paludibacter sp.]